MAANDDLEKTLRAGIEAARRGDRLTARRLLEQVVTADDKNELAWIWLASSVNTVSERRACLQKVLEINPNNARAREALQQLGGEARRRGAQDSQAVEQLRRMERARSQAGPPPRPRPPAQQPRAGLNVGYLIAAAVIVVVVLAIGVFGSSFFNPQPTPTPPAAHAAATDTPTEIPPSPTPFLANPETRTAPTLPPTFTPTATETATVTFTPTHTPYPLSEFPLFYTSLNPGESQPGLYEINADGSAERFVTANVRDIAYDPSGKKVAFVREVEFPADDRTPQGGIAPEIFVAPADNLEAAVKITDLRVPNSGRPSWGPNGVEIVFYSDYDGNEELYVMSDDGQNVRQLTFTENAINRDPAWSPDGRQIVFASDLNTPGSTEIYSLAYGGEESVITQLTNDNGSSYAPSWSPDGRLITFISDRGGDGDVFIMDASGQRPFLLTPDDGGAEDRSPAFTPDVRWVLFVSNREDDIFQVYLVNLRGSELVRVTNNGRDDQSLAVRPNLLLSLR